MVNFLPEDPLSPFAIAPRHNFDFKDNPVQESLGFWAPSLDPKNEERMPNEFRHWRRWSNHFDKDEDLGILNADVTSSCQSCGSKEWDMTNTDIIQVVQCATCGHTPTNRTSRYSNGHYSHHSKTLPEVYTSSISEASSLFSEATGIVEQDFASPKPRHPSGVSGQGIRSVRQSIIEPLPKPRWFETKQNMTFQFKLTPRTTPLSKPTATSASAPASTSASSASTSSSRPPNATGPASDPRGLPISELSSDPTAWQRLLTSALFLMKEEQMPAKEAPPKIIDLGLAPARQKGGKHLAMKHYAGKEHEAIVQNAGKDEAKRVLWKVVVKVGGGK